MAKILNIDTDVYNQTVDFILEGNAYKLHCYWNSRGYWYLSFYNPELFTSVEEAVSPETGSIVTGIRVMPDIGQNLIDISPDIGLPEGLLTTYDTNPNIETDEDEPRIKLNNFGKGKRFQLIYFTKNEVLELFSED